MRAIPPSVYRISRPSRRPGPFTRGDVSTITTVALIGVVVGIVAVLVFSDGIRSGLIALLPDAEGETGRTDDLLFPGIFRPGDPITSTEPSMSDDPAASVTPSVEAREGVAAGVPGPVPALPTSPGLPGLGSEPPVIPSAGPGSPTTAPVPGTSQSPAPTLPPGTVGPTVAPVTPLPTVRPPDPTPVPTPRPPDPTPVPTPRPPEPTPPPPEPTPPPPDPTPPPPDPTPPPPPAEPECSDGIDNDGDLLVDLIDLGCILGDSEFDL